MSNDIYNRTVASRVDNLCDHYVLAGGLLGLGVCGVAADFMMGNQAVLATSVWLIASGSYVMYTTNRRLGVVLKNIEDLEGQQPPAPASAPVPAPAP